MTTRPPALVTERFDAARAARDRCRRRRDAGRRSARREVPDPGPEPVSDRAREALDRRSGRVVGRRPRRDARDHARATSRDELLGTVSLRRHDRDRRAELGYWLGATEWGQGYATEASRALIEFGFARARCSRGSTRRCSRATSHRVACSTSSACSAKGIRRQHVRKGHRLHDVTLFGLLRDEWPTPDVR